MQTKEERNVARRAQAARWRIDHLELHRERSRLFRAANPKRYRAYRTKSTINPGQTPAWADMKAIMAFYDVCPDGFTVDHVIPFRSPLVCGLHVENNLQYLTKSENSRKKNRFSPIITSF